MLWFFSLKNFKFLLSEKVDAPIKIDGIIGFAKKYENYLNNIDTQNKNNIKNIVKNTYLRTFGFESDSNLMVYQKTNKIVKEILLYTFLTKPTNITFHNLCHDINLPNGINTIISLDLKFCLIKPKSLFNISDSNKKSIKSIKIKDWIKTYPKKI